MRSAVPTSPRPPDAPARAADPIVRASGLLKRYAPVGPAAVDGLELEVHRGEVLCLLGPSGCGKTTLLRLVAGFERPDAGSIEVAGRVVATAQRQVRPEQRRIGFVFQDFALFPHLTVSDNVAFGLRGPRAWRERRVAEMLDLVGMSVFGSRFPHQLSGGQQQRVALARSIVMEPRLLLFDEPLSNLDAKLREETRAELRDLLTRLAITSLYVTHDRFEALALSDDVVVMQSGNIVQRGTPDEVYFRSNTHFVVDFMGKANFLPGTVVGPEHPSGFMLADTAVGPLLCERRPGAHVGLAGQVAARMEFLSIVGDLADDGALPPNHVAATVTSEMFLGEYREVQLRAGDTKLVLRTSATDAIEPGRRVELRLDPAGCRFLTE